MQKASGIGRLQDASDIDVTLALPALRTVIQSVDGKKFEDIAI